MNDDKNVSILINNTDNILAVDSLKQQTFDKFECVLINNSIEQINNYIKNDSRFYIAPQTDINHIIQNTQGKYIIIINSDDMFTPNALQYIQRAIYLTDADIINFKTQKLNIQKIPKQYKPNFNYLCQKNSILEHVIDDLSCFCIKKDILLKIQNYSENHLVVFEALKMANDMTTTLQTYVLQKQLKNTNYEKIIDNFKANLSLFSEQFWKKYFKYFVQKMIKDNTTNKNSFISFCKNIPLKFVPLKYKLNVIMTRITNR